MRRISVLVILMLFAAAACLAQHGATYGSRGGFGNVVYPGTGHAPNAPITSYAQRLGNNIAGRPYYGYPGQANHPGHGRNAVVPYPVIVGGYGYGYGGGYGNGYDTPPPGGGGGGDAGAPPILNTNTAPSVVINQTFIPDRAAPARDYSEPPPPDQQSGMRTYEGLRTQPQPDPRATSTRANDQPTLYLIAFKSGNIVQALGYWVEGNTLNYVSAEHSVNQASLDLIDRSLSQRLNDERSVEFRLPPQQ